MFLTNKTKYAITAVLDLASVETSEPMRLVDIAKKNNISVNFLEQIFLNLKKNNIVKSVKGPGGGYILNAENSEISIIDIVEAVGENLKMTNCANGKLCNGRSGDEKCSTHDLWRGLGKVVKDYFSNIKLSDIAKKQYHINS